MAQFNTLLIGGGGFMTGLDLQADGTKLCKCDQNGCWLWNAGTGAWDNLLTPARGFAPAIPDPYAAYDMAAAPSNTNVIYIFLSDGNLYRSLDKGASFVQLTGFANAPAPTNNGDVRFNGRRIAVDPINQDVVYICCPGDGGSNLPVVRVTSNGSQGTGATPTFSSVASITAASGVTAGAPSGYNIAFDPNGGATSGKSNVVAVFSGGVGLFTTSAPLGAFTQATTTGAPTSCTRLICSTLNAAGKNTFYVANGGATLYKFAAAAWTSLTPPINAHSVSVDPTDNTRLLVADGGGVAAVSTNSGVSWTQLSNGANISPDIPWLALTQDGFKSAADMLFDPALTNSAMFAEGVGIFVKATVPNSGTIQWTTQTKGIENMTTNAVVASPTTTKTPTIAKWDRFGFYSVNQDAYPASQLPNNIYPIQVCWDMDWATSDQKTIVGYGQNNVNFTEASGTSSDNGQTWTFLPPTPLGLRTYTTSGASGIGTNTLTIASQPFALQLQQQVLDATHSGAIPAGTYITAINGATITLSQNIVSPGVSNGDTINVQFGGVSQYLTTTTSVVTGATVLTFASVPSNIKVGMQVNDVDDQQPTNLGSPALVVLSTTATTVTLNTGILGNIPSGALIQFLWPSGGCVAAASPSNFMMVPFPYPLVTADGGATWTAVDITGAPRPMVATFNGTSTVQVADTSALIVGMQIKTALGIFTSVSSITDATHFVVGTTIAAGTDVIFPETGWGNANYLNHKTCAADRVTANKFYLYNYKTGKVYVSTASGANGTWSQQNTVGNSSNATDLRSFANLTGGQGMAMKSVPGNAGHLFASNANVPSGGNNALIRSTDGGVNWSAVTNVSGVQAFGFGMPKPAGGGYPTVVIHGQLSGIKSMWVSDDNCVTWRDLDSRASGQTNANMGYYAGGTNIDLVCTIDGDKNVYNRFYFGFAAAGCGYFGDLTGASNVFGFSVIHGHARGQTKMIGY